MGESVTFDLELATKDFNRSLNKVDNNLKGFHKDFKKQAKSSAAAWSSFAGNLGAAAVGAAVSGLKNLVSGLGDLAAQSIKNAQVQEDAINDLNTALKGSGQYSLEASKDLQTYASALQKTTTFGDEAILSAQALGIQMAKLSGEDLKQATLAAANMASALNIDLNTAMRMIAKSTTDNGSGLKRYGVIVEAGVTQQETLANAIAATNEQFGGAAAGKINTYSGAMKQASNSYGDLLEEIGQIVTQSPALITLIQASGDIWNSLGKAIDDNTDYLQGLLKNGILWVIDGLKLMIGAINPVLGTLRVLSNTVEIITGVIKAAFYGVALAVQGYMTWIVTVILEALRTLPSSLVPDGWIESLEGAKESMVEVMGDISNDISDASNGIVDDFKDIGDAFKGTVSDESINNIKKNLDDLGIATANAKKADIKASKKHSDDKKAIIKDETSFINGLMVEQKQWEEQTSKEKVTNTKATLGQIATLSESNSKTLATIGKAAAISTATIDGIVAVQKALASAPPPWNFALAATVGVATAANVSKIAGFEDGGFIGGTSFSGDNVPINVNSGEAVLNASQQRNFMEIANGGGAANEGMISAINNLGNRIASMEFIIQTDDYEIGRSVNRAIEDGLELKV